jgi:hypothetical protein
MTTKGQDGKIGLLFLVLSALLVTGGPLLNLLPRVDLLNWLPAKHDVQVLGRSLELPKKSMFGTPFVASDSALVVFGGGCLECTINAVLPERLSKSPYRQVALILNASSKQIREKIGKDNSKVLVYSDPEERLSTPLGVEVKPRFFVVSNHRIIKNWTDQKTWPSAWTGDN